MSHKIKAVFSLTMVLGLALAACAAPEVVTVEKEVPIEVTRIVEKEVIVEAPAANENVVVVRVAGGSFGKAILAAFITNFTADTGIDVLYSPGYGAAAQVKAQHDAGVVEWDVVMQGSGDAIKNGEDGYLEEFDYGKIDSQILANIPEVFQGTYGPTHHIAARAMAYRTDEFPGDTGPKNWADFWDVEKFPGPRALFSGERGESDLEFALLADGVSKDELYPLDVERGMAKLDEIKPHIVKWWAAGGESTDMLVSGEVVMTDVWNGRIQPAIDAGEPIKIVWDGALGTTADWTVMTNAAHRDNAYKFIEYALRAENQAVTTTYMPYSTSNSRAMDHLDQETIDKLPTSPEHFEQIFLEDKNFLLSPYEDHDRFIEWMAEYWVEWVEQ
jgi:spermidine/putrescine-binding protein|tara:strand:+ start:136 stop:1296 length:1161 start_codon:yes stop_codon:yes gene_type:complete